MIYSIIISKANTCNATFLTTILLALLIALAGCDSPSSGLDEQRESSEAITGNVVTAESMGYEVKVTDLGPLVALDINNAGQIVGVKDMESEANRGFLWEDGKVSILKPLPGDVQSSALAINNNGRVIGRSINKSGSFKPVSWKNGKLCKLCTFKRGTSIFDINDERQLLGTRDGKYFVFKDGKFSYIDFRRPLVPLGNYTLNNSGVVAGNEEYDPPGPTEAEAIAFTWSDGKFGGVGTLGLNSWAYDINDKNEVVGWSSVAAFLSDDSGIKNLGTLGGSGGIATGINNKTQVVGASQTASGEWHVFLWEDGNMIDLGVDASDDTNTSANFISDFSINDNGQIIGSVRTSTGPKINILIEIQKN